MGYASCLENNLEKIADNWHLRGRPVLEAKPRPVPFAASPPLQPVLFNMVIPPPVRLDPEAIMRRERAMREKHILALHEIMPGHRWRG